jgi:signal transduction histidine kinase
VQDVEDMARETMGASQALVLRSVDEVRPSSALERAAREALSKGRGVAGEDNILAAPIALGLDRFGAIAVQMAQRPMFMDAALEMLGLVAAQSAAVLTAADALALIGVRNAELETANRAATEATRAKSEFLASMSHELRTPLNSILGFSDILTAQLAASMSERQTRYLRNIHEAGAHLLQLINDVLDLAKVEARRIELRQETISLDTLLAPVRQTAMVEAERRGLHFETKIQPDIVVNLDPLRTRQILLNLVSNAAKFTPKGGTITLRARGEEDESLIFEVADTGIGIPASKVGRVFGTFERFHEGRHEAEGTGLGLALTKQLVELHGGTIEFETAEGKGTSFTICLPQVVVPVVDDRLLVVDDEPRDAQLIAALAAREGFQVEVATSTQSALAAIRRRLPVAVVLDLRLPDGRGESVLEELNRLAPKGAVPTIVATVEDDEGASRLNGADDHLTKPLDHARLTGWLRQVAARRAAQRTKDMVHAAAAR